MWSTFPRDPITLSDDDWGLQSPPKRKVFRFHYHSQKVIGSLGFYLVSHCFYFAQVDLFIDVGGLQNNGC